MLCGLHSKHHESSPVVNRSASRNLGTMLLIAAIALAGVLPPVSACAAGAAECQAGRCCCCQRVEPKACCTPAVETGCKCVPEHTPVGSQQEEVRQPRLELRGLAPTADLAYEVGLAGLHRGDTVSPSLLLFSSTPSMQILHCSWQT